MTCWLAVLRPITQWTVWFTPVTGLVQKAIWDEVPESDIW